MRVLVHRQFEVARSMSVVWSNLARPAAWPSWAKHIKSVDIEPPGLLTASSSGVVRLRNGVRSRFDVVTFSEGQRWMWAGKFLWLRIEYDHVLEAVTPDRTRVTFDVAGGGFGAGSIGRLFAWIYAGNLDKAIPNLVAEIEGAGEPAK